MGNYKSAHTGAEIDNAVSRALPGGEIDAALSNKADRYDPGTTYPSGASCIHKGHLWVNIYGYGVTGVEPGTDYNVWNVTYSNRNLLDNWDFRNPVNQRGQTIYDLGSVGAPTLDRWRLNGGTLHYVSYTGVKWTKNYVLFQIVDSMNLADGKQRVVSYLDGDGTVYSGPLTARYTQIGHFSFTYDVGGALFMMSMDSEAIMCAVKLELGSVSTLANDPPADYGAELLKCQRYYWQSDAQFITKDFYNSFILICNAHLPVAMRAVPVITVTSTAGTKNTVSVWASGLDSGLKVTSVHMTLRGINAIYLDSNTPANVNDIYIFRLIANADL